MNRLKLFFIFGIFALLVIAAPSLSDFPYPSKKSVYSDFTITHYPNTIFIQRSLQQDRQIPLWSPGILSGYPIAANPLSGMWYPPNWLTWILPLPLGMNLITIMHLIWGGAGMFLLLARTGRSIPASVFGAAGFTLMPKVIAHFGAGHISLIQAVSWTPWLMLTSVPVRGTARSPLRRFLPAVILALIFLADVRWVLYSGAAWLGWDWVYAHGQKLSFTQLFHWIKHVMFIAGLALLLSGPLLLPFREYTALSTRSQLSAEESLVFSLPFEGLIGYFVFDFFPGAHEWVIYPGAAATVLAFVGFFGQAKDRRIIYWLLVCLIGAVFSFGSHIPGAELLASVPGFSLLRVPPRAMFLVGMGLNYLAAAGFDAFFEQKKPLAQRRMRLAILGWVALVLALAGMLYFAKGNGRWIGWQNAMIGGGIGILLLWASMVGGRSKLHRVGPTVLILLCVIDLGLAASKMVYFKSSDQVMSENIALTRWLAERAQGHTMRVYSPSYSVPQHQSALYELEMADGVDPLQLMRYVQFMEAATGIPVDNYSVTLPPYSNGDPKTANEHYSPDANLLGLLNVMYVVSEFELHDPDLVFVEQIDGAFVYQNLKMYPRSWIIPSTIVDGGGAEVINMIDYSPNRIEVIANGPGRLILAELFYPGWRVSVDGKPAEIEIYRDLLRSVSLAAGNHSVTFEYLPFSLLIGLAMQAAGLGILAVIYFRKRETSANEDV